MNITEEHLRHMAQRHHATMKKLEAVQDKFAGYSGHAVRSIETLAGAYAGGVVEGRTGGAAIGPLPVNLGAGLALVVASHVPFFKGKGDNDLNNFGNGFIASYFAATGYAFGKRWKESGHPFGGEGNPWRPYEGAGPPPPPAIPPAP